MYASSKDLLYLNVLILAPVSRDLGVMGLYDQMPAIWRNMQGGVDCCFKAPQRVQGLLSIALFHRSEKLVLAGSTNTR